jgi:predicted alpha/beta superfamily hydrolase
MHDAQNLFDEHGPFGNWAIDKYLAVLAASSDLRLIVVAIDHGETQRISEFSPFSIRTWGKGLGRKYVQFIVQTLKPAVDARYRSMAQREFTGIGGSSMGGLVSIYAGLMYPEVFGRLMIFSPSLWVSRRIYFDAIRFVPPYPTDVYLYAGGKESQAMLPGVHSLQQALEKQGLNSARVRFEMAIDPEGTHTEARWGQEFPRALYWLFGSNH